MSAKTAIVACYGNKVQLIFYCVSSVATQGLVRVVPRYPQAQGIKPD